MTAIELINILLGAALLLFGRRLFWLFVAGVGFLTGALLATTVFTGVSDVVLLMIALVVGVIGALIAVFLQHAVVAVAGFFAGGYLLHALVGALGYAQWAWIGFVIGGVLGAVLVLSVLPWALIALSSLLGAATIVQSLPFNSAGSALLFVVLCVIGIVVQAWQLPSTRPPEEVSRTEHSRA